MAETLTDVDQFDATIQMPTAGETISAADVRDKAIQRLANRTYYNKLNITDLQDAARYTISGTSQFSVQEFTLTEDFENGGFTDAANLVTFPGTGIYLVSLAIGCTHSLTNNPQSVTIGPHLYSSVAWSGTQDISWASYRYSATASDGVYVSGSGILNITDTATQKLFLTAYGTGTITESVTDPFSKLTIARLSL